MEKATFYTTDDVVEMIIKERNGSPLWVLAHKWNMSPQSLSAIITKKQLPNDKVLAALELKRVEAYEKV
jgi:hypothetical protein